MPDTEERFDLSDVSPEEAGGPPSEEDARPSLAEREAALEAAGLEQLSEKHRELNLERAGTVEEAAEMVKQEVEAEREDAVRETNEQAVRFENRYNDTLAPDERSMLEDFIGKINTLARGYEAKADEIVQAEDLSELKAQKKAAERQAKEAEKIAKKERKIYKKALKKGEISEHAVGTAEHLRDYDTEARAREEREKAEEVSERYHEAERGEGVRTVDELRAEREELMQELEGLTSLKRKDVTRAQEIHRKMGRLEKAIAAKATERSATPKQAETEGAAEEQARAAETPETPSPPPHPGGEGRVEWLRAQGREDEANAELQRQTLRKLEEEHGPTEDPEEIIELTEEMKKKPEEPAEKTDKALPETIDWTEVEDWQEGLKKKEEFEKLAKEKGFIDWTEVGEDVTSQKPETPEEELEKPEEPKVPEQEPKKRQAERQLLKMRATVPNLVPKRVRQSYEEQRPVGTPPPQETPAPPAAETEKVSEADKKMERMRNAMRNATAMERAARRIMTKTGGAAQAEATLRAGMDRLESAKDPASAREAIAELGLLSENDLDALPDEKVSAFTEAAAEHARGTLETIEATREKDRRPSSYIDKDVYDERGRLRKPEKKKETPATREEPGPEKAAGKEDTLMFEGEPLIDVLTETMSGHLDRMEEEGIEIPRKVKVQRLLKDLTSIEAITAEQGKALLQDTDAREKLLTAYEDEVKKRNKGKA